VLAYFPGNVHTLIWGEMAFPVFFFESKNSGLHAVMITTTDRITTSEQQTE